MGLYSFCLTLAMLDTHVPYIDTLYLSDDYAYAVLVVRKRATVNLFIEREQGPVDYIVCKSNVKSGQKNFRAQIEDTHNGFLTKGFKFSLDDYITSAIASGSLDFSPAHVKIADGCVVFGGKWIAEYGEIRAGHTAFVIHQIASGARAVLKWEDVIDKTSLEKLSKKTLHINQVVRRFNFEKNVLGIELKWIDGIQEESRIQKTVNLSK